MINFYDKKFTNERGVWEATMDGRYLACRGYLNNEEKFEMLVECIELARQSLEIQIQIDENNLKNE